MNTLTVRRIILAAHYLTALAFITVGLLNSHGALGAATGILGLMLIAHIVSGVKDGEFEYPKPMELWLWWHVSDLMKVTGTFFVAAGIAGIFNYDLVPSLAALAVGLALAVPVMVSKRMVARLWWNPFVGPGISVRHNAVINGPFHWLPRSITMLVGSTLTWVISGLFDGFASAAILIVLGGTVLPLLLRQVDRLTTKIRHRWFNYRWYRQK